MKIIRLILSTAIMIALVYFLNRKIDTLPPLGKFFNPFGGFWQNAEPKKIAPEQQIKIPGLQNNIEILLDDRLVPHVFAQNERDMYFAQGYITAKYRLWQMEFQTFVAAGRLSEILGKGKNGEYLERDKFNRRMGMDYAAQRAIDTLVKYDDPMKKVLDAYTDGVNAYINQLSSKDYPIEYKLLDYSPEPWTPKKCFLLLKYMSYDLSTENDDWKMTNILRKYKRPVVDELFPNYPRKQDPIIPPGTRQEFRPLMIEVPKMPKDGITAPTDEEQIEKEKDLDKQMQNRARELEIEREKELKEGKGSNNWAIAADKSETGFPILANDPHLTLNLPSIWFEIQLTCPEISVYGVSLPGAPMVIIGFNNNISWGVTNVGSDVMDWYKIRFKDKKPLEYLHDRQWKKTTKRLEKMKVRGGSTVTDTVYFTHHGPIVARSSEDNLAKAFNRISGDKFFIPKGYALRWLAHDPSNELMTFYILNKAKNHSDYKRALTYYTSPAQNFVFADVNKDIAITPNGKFPLKWRGQGKYLLDGTNPSHDWGGWLPPGHNPNVKNPVRGFVSSANQFSIDTLFPYYMNWEYAPYDRGMRINEYLARLGNKITVQDFIDLQNDNMSMKARSYLPKLLTLIDTTKLDKTSKKSFEEMSKWNYHYKMNKMAPSIFKTWWNLLSYAIWDDDFGDPNLRYPADDMTGDLILRSDTVYARWFDNVKTKERETLKQLVNTTFLASLDSLSKNYGKMGDNWKWSNVKKTSIKHLMQIPAFGVNNLSTNGDNNLVNATGKRNGPSWKMIVALGKTIKAYGVYPGGQSGNPGSFYYANMIETWRKGELYELLIMKKSTDKSDKLIGKITLTK